MSKIKNLIKGAGQQAIDEAKAGKEQKDQTKAAAKEGAKAGIKASKQQQSAPAEESADGSE